MEFYPERRFGNKLGTASSVKEAIKDQSHKRYEE